jgi:hypothetical protein
MAATFATVIRDGAYSRLQAANPGVTTFRKTPLPPVQPATQLPSLGVYFTEQMTPEGDYDVGEPKFFHEVTLYFSAVDSADAQGLNEEALDAIVNNIMTTLLCDGSFMMLFEGVTSMRRGYFYPEAGDTYFAEVRLAMTIVFRTNWPPEAPNAFLEMDVYPVPSFDGSTAPAIVVQYPQSGNLTGVAGIGLAGSLSSSEG